jgi:hypothetical protein
MNIIGGAKMLAELLEQRHGPGVEARAIETVKTAGALPVFHWVGREPPAAAHPGADIDDTLLPRGAPPRATPGTSP